MTKTISIIKYFTAYLFIGLAIGSYYPILSSYLEEDLFLSGKQTGLILAITPIISIIVLPIWGMLTDVIKSPKKTLFTALLFSSIVVFSLSVVNTYISFLILISIFMIFRAPIFTLYDEILIGVCKEKEINYGFLRMAGSLGFSVALFFGMFYSKIYGNHVQFIISSLFFLIVSLLILLIEDVKYKEKEKINLKRDLPVLFKNKYYIIITILFSITFGALDSNLVYIGNYIEKFSYTDKYVPWAIFLSASIEIPILFSTKYLYKKLSLKQIILFINVINIFRYLMMFLFPTYISVLILAPIHGITFGLGYPILVRFISDKIKKKVLASAYAFNGAIYALFTSIISYLTGFIIDLFPFRIHYIFILYIFLYCLNTFFIIVFLRKYDYHVNEEMKLV